MSGTLVEMSGLRMSVLGVLEVYVDGAPRDVPPGRQRTVLVCLLVHLGHPVPADTLIEAAWRDGLPQDPHKALRTVLSRLRAVLGRESIVLGPGGYRLSVDAVDGEEFLSLVAEARSAEPGRAVDLLERALALWRGPAFGEYADAPFATSLAQSLEQFRLDAIEAHASTVIHLGDPAAAVPRLQGLLAEQPFRESAVELLATALYQAGRQTEALERLRVHRTLLADELGLDPAPSLTELEARILGHDLRQPSAVEGELPDWLDTSTAFVGRETEVDALSDAVADNRLTTVTGPGGVGKSRLVAEALPEVHHRMGLPVTVVELAPVRRGQVLIAVADRLGLGPGTADREHSGDEDLPRVVEQLVELLAAAPRLVVLDNCEHAIPEVSALAEVLTRRCSRSRVLATSRRRLGIAAEQVLPLGPLPVPDLLATTGSQEATASVRLLADRIRRLQPAFSLDPETIADVAELCRRCEGLPLALELAASRTVTSGLRGVLARFPTEVVGDAGDLASVVAWSYQLLAPDSQALLDGLSVFAGDFTDEAVVGLMRHVPGWSGDASTGLAELVDSSLVMHQVTSTRSRFRLLEMVRSFAERRLAASSRADQLGAAHGEWVREQVTRLRSDWDRLDGAVVAAGLSDCSVEVAVALRRVLSGGDLALASQISCAVAMCLHWTPGLDLRDLMIEVGRRACEQPGSEVAGAVAAAAFALAERGDVAGAQRLAGIAQATAQDGDALALATLSRAVAAMYTGDLDDSARWFRNLARDPRFIGEANTSLSLIAAYSGDRAAAQEHAQVALAARGTGSDASAAFAQYAAGEVAALTDPSRAARMLAEAAQEADRVMAEQVSRVARLALCALLVRGGRHEEAATLGARLCADLRLMGAWTQVWTLVRVLAELLAARELWSESAFCLGAVEGAPGAPPAVGQDVPRYAELRSTLAAHLSVRVLESIQVLAAATPRAQVLSRVERALLGIAPRASKE